MYRAFFKRLLDICGAIFLIVLTLPIMAVVAVLIYFKVSKDVIFTQARPGLHAKIFKIYKFKTSFIGPRPLLVEYLPLYDAEQATRHDVRPGITGLAQVNGRNAISWAEKFKFDARYVRELSFALDVKIAILTVQKVLKRSGVSKEGMATTEKFNGRN